MNIRAGTIRDIRVLAISGKIDSLTARAFDEELKRAIAGRPGRILLDCSGLEYINSAGLRVILGGLKDAKNEGIGLALCSICPEVRKVFEYAGFTRFLVVFPGVDESLGTW